MYQFGANIIRNKQNTDVTVLAQFGKLDRLRITSVKDAAGTEYVDTLSTAESHDLHTLCEAMLDRGNVTLVPAPLDARDMTTSPMLVIGFDCELGTLVVPFTIVRTSSGWSVDIGTICDEEGNCINEDDTAPLMPQIIEAATAHATRLTYV